MEDALRAWSSAAVVLAPQVDCLAFAVLVLGRAPVQRSCSFAEDRVTIFNIVHLKRSTTSTKKANKRRDENKDEEHQGVVHRARCLESTTLHNSWVVCTCTIDVCTRTINQ